MITPRQCNCAIHRYSTAHLCACGELISHSQRAWNKHKFHAGMIDFDSVLYQHDMTADAMFDYLLGYGISPFARDYRAVYDKFAELQEITARANP